MKQESYKKTTFGFLYPFLPFFIRELGHHEAGMPQTTEKGLCRLDSRGFPRLAPAWPALNGAAVETPLLVGEPCCHALTGSRDICSARDTFTFFHGAHMH